METKTKLSILAAVAVLALSGLKMQSELRQAKIAGRVEGCSQVVAVVIAPYAPVCSMREGQLVFTLTHPASGEQRTFDAVTGQRVE